MAKALKSQGNGFRERLLRLLGTDEEVKARVHALLLESEVLKELRAFREDANARFETLATELRDLHEDTNRRFEAMDKRFEAVDRRFEALITELREHRESADRRFETVVEEIRGLRKTLDTIGSRWGIQTEEAVRKFAQEFIASEFGVTAQSWSYAGGQLDLIIRNGQHYLIEVKSTGNSQEVQKFASHIAAYQEETHIIPARKIMVTAHATSDAFKEASGQGIEMIAG